jgi:hypothetical protein
MSDIYLGPHDIADWIEAAPALLTSSIVENGSWYAAARFGAQDATETWQQQFAAIFAQIPADQWLAVVDYHL